MYTAICVAHLLFPHATYDIPPAFALELKNNDTQIYVDLSALRPDPRDDTEFLAQSMTVSGIDVTVVLQKVNYTDVSVDVPRYIIHKNKLFRNIRV